MPGVSKDKMRQLHEHIMDEKRIRDLAKMYHAPDPEIEISEYTGVGSSVVQQRDIAVRVDLPPAERTELQDSIRSDVSVESKVSVVPKDDAVFTDPDLHQLMRAAPDDWEPGDELSLDMFDQDVLYPIINDYGSLRKFHQAVQNSLAETPDRADDAYALRHHGDGVSLTVPDEDDSDTTVDDLTALKQSYVSGEIGLIELENRLEDVLTVDVPYEPV